jgi:hypothetical protein
MLFITITSPDLMVSQGTIKDFYLMDHSGRAKVFILIVIGTNLIKSLRWIPNISRLLFGGGLNASVKNGIREAVFLLTTLSSRWVAISGRLSSPAFAGCSAAPATTTIANPFVNLANHRVGQPIEG